MGVRCPIVKIVSIAYGGYYVAAGLLMLMFKMKYAFLLANENTFFFSIQARTTIKYMIEMRDIKKKLCLFNFKRMQTIRTDTDDIQPLTSSQYLVSALIQPKSRNMTTIGNN